jgi:hypothetical protein
MLRTTSSTPLPASVTSNNSSRLGTHDTDEAAMKTLPGGTSLSSCGGDASPAETPYAQLIYRALMSREDRCMSLQEIYQWFREHTNKTDGRGKGWQNSIRHNLSMNQVSSCGLLLSMPISDLLALCHSGFALPRFFLPLPLNLDIFRPSRKIRGKNTRFSLLFCSPERTSLTWNRALSSTTKKKARTHRTTTIPVCPLEETTNRSAPQSGLCKTGLFRMVSRARLVTAMPDAEARRGTDLQHRSLDCLLPPLCIEMAIKMLVIHLEQVGCLYWEAVCSGTFPLQLGRPKRRTSTHDRHLLLNLIHPVRTLRPFTRTLTFPSIVWEHSLVCLRASKPLQISVASPAG